MKQYQTCNHCGYAYSSPSAKNCELCGENLNQSTNRYKANAKKKLIDQVNENKLNVIIVATLAAAIGLGFFNLTRPIGLQAGATKKLPHGVLRYWGPPCSERLMSEKIARAINKDKGSNKNNEGKFKSLWADVDRNRDAIAELMDKQISIVLHEKGQFPHHQKRAKEKGVDLEGVPYALDGIAYIANRKIDNVEYLTIENLEKIYRGEITNWKEVGGEDKTITPILLSGLGRNSLFLNFRGKLNPNILYVEDRKTAMSDLKQNEGALFYTSATLAAQEKGVNIIPLRNEHGFIVSPVVDGKVNQTAFIDGSYPQIRTLFAIYRKDDRDKEHEMVKAFIDFLTSPEPEQGQSIVKEAGFVPLYLPIRKDKLQASLF